jgi:hypothetical protein
MPTAPQVVPRPALRVKIDVRRRARLGAGG